MYRSVILVGTSPDGPEGIITDVISTSYLEKSFGWSKFEHHTLAASGSAFTTRENIFGESFEIWEQGASLLKTHQLYNPTVTAPNTISFTSMPSSADYIVKYTPEQDDNSLILGALDFHNVNGIWPSVLRVQGTKATATIGDYTFTARYSGARYNGILITVASDNLSVYDPNQADPKTKVYPTSNGFNTLNQMRSDFNLQMLDIDVVGPRRETLALPVGSYALTGGVAGTISSGSVIRAIQDMDLSQVGYVAVAGGMASGDIEAVASYLEENSTYIPMLIAGSVVSLSGSVTSGYLSSIQNWGLTSERVIFTPGWVNMEAPIIGSRWTAPTSIFAAHLINGKITNQPTPAVDYSPIWTKAELEILKSTTCPLNRFIRAGVGFYHTVSMSSQRWPRLALIEFIVSRATPLLDNYIGKPAPPADEVSSALSAALSSAPFAKSLEVMVGVARDYIDVEITAQIYGELDEITISLSSKR